MTKDKGKDHELRPGKNTLILKFMLMLSVLGVQEEEEEEPGMETEKGQPVIQGKSRQKECSVFRGPQKKVN